MTKPVSSGRYRSHIIALEPRMMFDAAAAVVVADALSGDVGPAGGDRHDVTPVAHRDGADTWREHGAAPDAGPAEASARPSRDIIFINTSVADYRELAAEWATRGEVVLIDATRDGIDQVRSSLAGRSDISAIHIVSHGSAGTLELGTTRIDRAAITGDLAASLGAIGRTLASDGDILIYGCDFAEGTVGADALAAFARATDADVAASTDTTGFAMRGGDWTLEAQDGSVETRSLDGGDWVHTLDPNIPVPIAVTADSLTVRNAGGTVVTTGATGYGTDARSPDVGAGGTAVWAGAATFNGRTIDLRATVVSISAGDAVRFNRPTGTGANGDDPTLLLRDLSAASDAFAEIRWELLDSATGDPLPANVRFTIADIDGIGGNANSRETVVASTQNLAYYTRERVTNIAFAANLDTVTASGTQNENTDTTQPVSPGSAATFDWSSVSAFTLTYRLATNATTTQAQFFNDGDADFVYTDPIYISIPRLDLDGNNSTANGNDAAVTFAENGPRVRIVDADLVVANPMPSEAITGATVRLTNWRTGDNFAVGALPAGLTATIGAVVGGTQTITFSGTGSESDYADAFRAITFANASDTPDATQRVVEFTFTNDTLTSATAIGRITVVPVNDAPLANADTASTAEDRAVTIVVLGNDTDPDGNPLSVTAASAPNGTVVRNANGTLTYTPNANFNGTDTISYTISDGNGGTASSTVTVRVAPQPDAPANGVPATQSATEDTNLTFSTANGNALTVGDVDGGNQTVTIAVTRGNFTLASLSGLTFTTGDGTADPTMTFTGTIASINTALNGARFVPVADANGAAALTLTTTSVAVDGEDFQNGDAEAPGVPDNSSRTFMENQVPGWETTASDGRIEIWGTGHSGVTAFSGRQFFEINANQAASLYQDVRSVAGSAISVDFAHRGRAGTDTMRLIATDLGADGTFGTTDDVVVAQQEYSDGNTAWGAYSRQLTTGATGNLIRIEFRSVSTASGDQSVGNFLDSVMITQASPPTSDTDTVVIAITPVADIAGNSATTPEETAVMIGVLANDSFENAGRAITAIDGQSIVAGGAAIAVANGRVTLGTDAQLTFTPRTDYTGTTSFTYTVTSNGTTETATTTVTVTSVDDPLVAVGTLPPRSAADAAAVNIATAGGFSDPDGDALTYSATGLPSGLTIDAATGVISGTLGRSASQAGGGAYAITVTARDPSNATRTQSFTLTVTNPDPTAVNDATRTVAEDTATTIVVLANDSDPDGDPLTITAATALNGTVVRNADGTLTYTPNANYTGADTISYTISDGEGGTASATAAITVSSTNDGPIAVNDAVTTVVEDTPTTVAVLTNDSDPDGDPLTVIAATALNGTVVRNADGTLTYTPNANYTGPDTITYTISDGNGGTASATAAITVTPVNDAPVALGTLPPRSAVDAAVVSIATAGGFSDPEGDTLTYSATGLPAGVTIDAATGVISGTLGRSASQAGGGTYAINVTARDPSNATRTQSFTLTVSNPDPTAVNDATTTVAEDTATTITVLGNDSDPDGDPLTVTAASALNGTVVRNASGTLTYTPNANFAGTDTISYTISDGEGGTASATAAIFVSPANDAPVAVGTLPPRAAIDAAVVSIATAGGFSDPDGDALTYSATGLPAGLTIDAATGLISGSLGRSASQAGGGAYAITVTARDPSNATRTQDFTLTVTNPGPTAVNDATTTAAEDTATTITVLGNDSDPDGDPLTVTAATALNGTVVRNADGTLTYTPNANYTGADTISYTISDGEGGTASATSAITVMPVNDTPTVTGTIPAQTAADAAGITIVTAGAFTDPEGDTLAYSATGLPAGLSIDPATGAITGTLDRAASQVNGGRYTVAVTARDPSNSSATQTFVFTATNPPPVAVDDRTTVVEDVPTTIPVLANDSDPDGDPLTVTAASALHGTVVRNADGTLTYTPDANYTGADTIRYTIDDGNGGTSSAGVAVTVTAVNDAPVPVGTLPPRTGDDGSTVTFPTAPGFSDVDGDTLTFAAAGLPGGLSIDAATGVVSGTLDPAASQQNGGRYTVVIAGRDPFGAVATQSFAFLATNPGPVAVDDAATVVEDTPTTIPVLANDRDPNGDPLRVTTAVAGHGRVTINTDGTLTYTPDADYTGPDTIRYTIDDGRGATASASVAIAVTPVNDAPAATRTLPDRAGRDGAVIAFATAGAFRDVDGDRLTYTASGLPAGLTIDATTGVVSGTLDRSASQTGGGRYTVAITARDPGGAIATTSFVLTVTNPAPIAADDRATARPGAPIDIAILANDGDIDGDPLTVTRAGAVNGAATVNQDGSLRYISNPGFTGTDTVTYTISDGQGGTATAIVRVDVLNALPSSGTIPDVAARDGQAFSLGIGPRFVDPDGDPLTFTATGLPPGLSIDRLTGTITGTIDRSASATDGGVYASIITASDGFGGTVRETLRWTIINPGPTAVDDRATIAEDMAVTLAVLENDSDPDGDVLTVIAASAGRGSVTITSDGALRYTPAADFVGGDTITYTIADAQGARASASVVVTITPVNDRPRGDTLPRYDATDGTDVMIPTDPGFTDPEGGALSFDATGLPPGLAINPDTGTITGTITPGSADDGPNRDGVFPVTVTVTDPDGLTVSSSFDLVVGQDAPTARDDSATVREDTPTVIDVLANDTDGDADPLTIAAASATHGTVTIDGDSLIFTPDRDFTGTATITYTVVDPSGRRDTAVVMIVVTPVDDAPTATPIASQAGLDGGAVALDLGGFFTDVDGDTLRYTAIGLPAGLSIDPASGRVTGTIDRGASQVGGGIYRVTIIATANDRAASAAFDWVVANPAPIALDDVVRTAEDTPVVLAPLGNDSDPDGDPIRIVGATAARGTVAIGADGRLTYTPSPDYNGDDAILYTIDDGNGGRATAVVRIVVDPVNDAPVAAAGDPIPAVAGKPVLIDPLPRTSDVDGDDVTITGATTANGTVAVLPDGTLRFVPDVWFKGSATITYTISDGNGGTGTGTIVVAVAAAPTADVNQLLAIGSVHFRDPTPAMATIFTTDGIIRNPITLLDTVEGVRTLNTTRIGTNPVGDAVNAIRSLNGTSIDANAPIAGEVRRLDAIADRRDAGDRLFDHRWSDFDVRGLSGFSAAADRDACIMVESVVRGGAIYLEVRDIAEDGRAGIRSIDIRDARGNRPDWITVDPRGLAIIERGADMDELHLIVRVVREDGRATTTPIVVQGATGEIELDRPSARSSAMAQPLDNTLVTSDTFYRDAAARLASSFE